MAGRELETEMNSLKEREASIYVIRKTCANMIYIGVLKTILAFPT